MLQLAGLPSAVALNPLSSTSLLASLGALGVFLALFAETGLLIGFFLPGDSLLFTAGVLCAGSSSSKIHLSLPLVLLAAAGGALLGAQTGFAIGRKGGRAWLGRTRNRFLLRGAERSEHLLSRYGYGKAIVLARFVPVVRTVLNPMVGALDVPARSFTIWQVAGGLHLVRRRHHDRFRARLDHRQRGQVPAADHRGDHRDLAAAARDRGLPQQAGSPS